MWIKGAPTEPGYYWVLSDWRETESKGDIPRTPEVWLFAPSHPDGTMSATVSGSDVEVAPSNSGKIRLLNFAWIVAHQPIAEPEAYAP